jgi:hypothetical protein
VVEIRGLFPIGNIMAANSTRENGSYIGVDVMVSTVASYLSFLATPDFF